MASALVNAARAAGCSARACGSRAFRPEIAHTLVQIGENRAGVVTLATLERGIAYALAR